MSELKPCPFCGGDAETWLDQSGQHPRRKYGCSLCNVDMEDADITWNTRPIEDALQAKLDASQAAHTLDVSILSQKICNVRETLDSLLSHEKFEKPGYSVNWELIIRNLLKELEEK